jgi:tetratricopeptide (TPR) repeat protein/tRNA A-37 threonylcarbamoyl transferase component Bud32
MRPPPADCRAREDLLDVVLTGYLKAAEAGEAPDREGWLARYPDLAADLRDFFRDQDQLDRFAGPLRPAGKAARVTVGPESPDPTVPESASTRPGIEARCFGEYELLEVIAEGGMGVVYKARHRKLQRLVALKVLLAGRFARPSDLQRFRNEAETIAALDHPNIVPVYEVGERDGQLFLSLRLLDGTLSNHLEHYGGDPRAAASLLVTVALAVHHAHQRGVLHRDLKPSNILLDAVGQPHVADFGLARRLEDDSGLTQTGAILGTPSYMAPEQTVAGRRVVTTAADVYGLGGILYALLTGGPPFQGDDVFDTMAQVRERAPESPARRNPRVSRELATICLKCLEKEPARRYASAQELADDLGRFLRNEPTRARPVGPARRLAKWVRRRPALAALIGVTGLFLVAFLVSLLVYNVHLKEAVQRANDKEAEARRQQRLATENYRQARETINKMLVRLEGRGLAEIPRLKELSQDQLEDALSFFRRALDALEDPDPEVRRDTAVAYRRAADIQQTLGRLEAADDNYRRAIRLLDELPAETRDAPENQALLSGCYTNLATAAQNRRLWDEAEKNYRHALAIEERLAEARPDDPSPKNGLAEAEHNLGTLRQLTNKPREAEPHYDRAVTLRARLVHDHPDVPAYRAALAGDYVNLASIYMNSARPAEARDTYEKAEKILSALVKEEPEKPEHGVTLAAAYVNWSHLVRADGRPDDALRLLDRAVELTEAVLRREPNYAYARLQGYGAHGARAQLYEGLDRFPDAVKDWDRAIDLESNPNPWNHRALRATTLVRAKEYPRALDEVAALEGNKEISDVGLYHLAGVCALAVETVRKDGRLSSTEQAELAERFGARGVSLLRKLKERGYFKNLLNTWGFNTDPNMKPLRERDDYKQLIAPSGGTQPK